MLAPLGDIPAFLARPQTILTAAQAAALAAAYTRLTAELGRTRHSRCTATPAQAT